jgi:lipopolysaccharide biosynthesis regulator YciM
MRKDKITEAVIEDLKSRSERGIKKYNTTLDQNNKDDYMNHLYEELLDAAQYAKKEMSIIPMIQKMIEENPNDQELGILIRETFKKF